VVLTLAACILSLQRCPTIVDRAKGKTQARQWAKKSGKDNESG